uniref:Uncharacterized protein n=1 Tax=Dictyoglomus turgidum TaxID=513050 RepID=A0A7C3SN32_9BACT
MEIKDFYSHPHLIKTKFPTPETLPEVIKTAKIVPKSNLNALPDHAFALVTQENGDKIRKFACYDKASTILSTIFLLDYNPELPENLKKVAAINLKKACTFYDIVPPDPLIKLAGEISNEDNPEFVKSAGLTAKKADEIVGKMTQILLETKEKTESEVEKKGAYCLPEQKKYPLHSYRQTMAAIDYFQKYATRFDPQTRRTYAKNLEKRASELAIALPDIIKKYASETPAPVTEVYEGLSRRMHLRPDMANAYEK